MKTVKSHLIAWAILALLIFASNCFGQTVKIIYPGYVSYWNSKTLIPDSVIYTATAHSKVASRSAGFHSDGHEPNLTQDYSHSGYDIGHFCNASDENGNTIDEYNSFSFCNVAPQLPNLNRLTWLALENYIRQLTTKYSSVKVKIYWHGIKGYIGKDKVTIPLYCDKEIWYSNQHEKYSMPNIDTINKHNFTYYKKK